MNSKPIETCHLNSDGLGGIISLVVKGFNGMFYNLAKSYSFVSTLVAVLIEAIKIEFEIDLSSEKHISQVPERRQLQYELLLSFIY